VIGPPFTGELLPWPTAGGAPLDAIVGEEIFLVAFAYELRAVGGAVPAATVADDPDEELFAVAAVWEAAIGGFCAFEVDALI
jgi:hypothetical protein